MSLDLEKLPAGPLRDFYGYWLSLKVADQVPQVEAFQLVDIPHLVSNILVIEYSEQHLQYRYSGSNFNMTTGQDLTGLNVDELPNVEDLLERLHNCRRTGEPYFVSDHPITWTSRDFKTYSVLVVPLADTEGKVARLVCLVTFS